MNDEIQSVAKPLIESAVTHYANVFRSIAEENPNSAATHMTNLHKVDHEAKENLSSEGYLYYEQQRNTLLKRFGERLVGELEDQLQGDMIDSARRLIDEIEKMRTE